MKVEQLKIVKVLDTESGTSKAGKAWKKVTFVGETDQEYNNLYAFEIFQGEGKDQVDNFLNYNKEGDVVNVEFNVSCREWQGKYFTNLSAWRVEKANGSAEEVPAGDETDDLPF